MKKESLNHSVFENFLQNYEKYKKGFFDVLEGNSDLSKTVQNEISELYGESEGNSDLLEWWAALNYYDKFLNLIEQNSSLFGDVYSVYSTILESFRRDTLFLKSGFIVKLPNRNEMFLSHYYEVEKAYQSFFNTFSENNIPTTFLQFSLFAPLELLMNDKRRGNLVTSEMTQHINSLRANLGKREKRELKKNSLINILRIVGRIIFTLIFILIMLRRTSK